MDVASWGFSKGALAPLILLIRASDTGKPRISSANLSMPLSLLPPPVRKTPAPRVSRSSCFVILSLSCSKISVALAFII